VIIKTKADLLDGPQILKSVVQAQIYISKQLLSITAIKSAFFQRKMSLFASGK